MIIKGTVFFFFLKKFMFCTFLGKIDWLNEKAVFFFPAAEKKNTDLRSIEWMTLWTFTGKKNTKKKYSFWKKKNGPRPTFADCIFFFRILEKKYTILDFDWLNGQRTFSGKKKYGTFGGRQFFGSSNLLIIIWYIL